MKKFLSFLLVLALGLVFVGCGDETVKPTKIEISGENEVEVGKTINLVATVTPADATDKSVEWSSSDNATATVDKGAVKGVKEGTVTITVTSKVDSAVKAEVKITVKEAAQVVEVKPTSIEVSGENQVEVGKEVTLTAVVKPDNATNKAVTWKSSDETVATVAAGKVKGVKAGTATITVTASADAAVVKTFEITVVEGEPQCEHNYVNGSCEKCGEAHACEYVNGVCSCGAKEVIEGLPEFLQITNQRTNVVVGSELALGVTAYPVDAEKQEVVWSVDNESVATIDEYGLLKAVATGKVKVTVKSAHSDALYNAITINVVETEEEADKLVESLEITSTKEKYLKHESLNSLLEKTWTPADATNKTVYWESSDESVVAIYKNARTPYIPADGVAGTVTLYCFSASNPEVYAEVEVTVADYVEPTSFTIHVQGKEAEETTIRYQTTRQITVVVEPEDGNPGAIYETSDPAVATVDENGLVQGVEAGECTITVTSKVNPAFVKTIKVIHEAKVVEVTDPEKVTVDGEKVMYIGYKIKVSAKVYPENVSQSITWEVHSKSADLATIDEQGYINAVQAGTFRVRAVSVQDPKVKSDWFSIDIQEPTPLPIIGDMKGYQIIIMNADSALGDNDPFLESYKQSDKIAKQKAWTEVETNYNCDIQVVAYPPEAPWGAARINWIIDNATTGTSQCDLGIVSTNWIYQFAQANAAVDVSEYYGKYGMSQMEPALKSAGSYKGKLYVASTGISTTSTFVDLGLYYNYGWLKQLGVENPAKMFNEGRWTYTNFKEWVLATQAKLGENEYAIGGAPYYYWYGMTNAAGQVIANTETSKVNITSEKSQAASELIYSLVEAGAVNTNITWAETDDVANSFFRSDGGGTLMTTGYLWFVRNSGRWTEKIWGEGTTEFGYVPFPYPDDVAKEDTRIGVSGLSAYMYIAGRSYPTELGSDAFQKVWLIMNEMFLNTIKYQEEDPLFNAEKIIETSLKSRIDDPESIKAIMFYNAKRVIYDPAHAIYSSTSATPLKAPANNAMFYGKDYAEEFNSVYEQYETDFLMVYSAS